MTVCPPHHQTGLVPARVPAPGGRAGSGHCGGSPTPRVVVGETGLISGSHVRWRGTSQGPLPVRSGNSWVGGQAPRRVLIQGGLPGTGASLLALQGIYCGDFRQVTAELGTENKRNCPLALQLSPVFSVQRESSGASPGLLLPQGCRGHPAPLPCRLHECQQRERSSHSKEDAFPSCSPFCRAHTSPNPLRPRSRAQPRDLWGTTRSDLGTFTTTWCELTPAKQPPTRKGCRLRPHL